MSCQRGICTHAPDPGSRKVRQARGVVDRLVRSLGSLAERYSLELLVAWARVALALVLVVSNYLAPIEPAEHIALVNGLLLAYAIYSGSVLALLRLRTGAGSSLGPILHGLDLSWAVLLTLWTEGPDSHLFLLFVFAVLAAAYRWGLGETLVTAFTAIILLVVETSSVARQYTHTPFHLNYFLIRTLQLALFGLVVGLLSEREKTLRLRAVAISRVMRMVRFEGGSFASMHGALDELRALFGSERVLLAVEESLGGRLFLWATLSREQERRIPFGRTELDPSKRGVYFFGVPDLADVWGGTWRPAARTAEAPALMALDAEGRRVEVEVKVPGEFVAEHSCRSLICVSEVPGADRHGRLFLVNPSTRADAESSLTLLQAIVRQVGPALENLFIADRLRTRIEEMERSRVARELHDGVVQSLIGLEMQLDVARRDAERNPALIAKSLEHIQGLLRHEILNLRDLMQQLRPIRVDSGSLTGFLSTAVDRFRRNTAIDASFVSEVDEVELAPRACRELVRVVEEALVNVRKHSGARKVIVRLGRRDGELNLTIHDDGRGFPFMGRLALEDLDRHHVGPLVIKERVRSIGGTLSIESDPMTGAELDITLPSRRYE